MSRRTIRLKEHAPSSSGEWLAAPEYLALTDGSIGPGPYPWATDEHGFLLGGAAHDPGRRTVYCLGDSFVESSFSAPEERFVARASRLVDANLVNAGYSGTTTLQLAIALLAKIAGVARRGDVVVAFAPKSDVSALLTPGGYWTGNRTYTPIQPGAECARPVSRDDERALLECVAAFARGVGLDLVIATSAHRSCDFSTEGWIRDVYRRDRERFERFERMKAQIDDVARETAADLGVPCFDLHRELGGDPALFYDQLHFNAAGQRRGAEALARFLERHLAGGRAADATASASPSGSIDPDAAVGAAAAAPQPSPLSAPTTGTPA